MPENTFDALPADALLRLPSLTPVCGLAKPTIYARVAQGTFPAPIKLSARSSGWRVGDIRLWLKNPSGYKAAA